MADQQMCVRCSSKRVAGVCWKMRDNGAWWGDGLELEQVPAGCGIEDAGYIEFKYCLDCGQIQGTWPVPTETFDEQRRWLKEDEAREGNGLIAT